MSLDEWTQPTVDPEVRAYVGSLVTAVGGTSIEEHGRYVLGDDALGCLKDLKRWIQFYDQKLNRLDVQRVLAESNLLKGDLLEILASWTEDQTHHKLKAKIALSCLELLVPLTWPLEPEDDKYTKNLHRHLPYLRLAQVEYKRAILHHDTAKILKTAARVMLPSLAIPRADRAPRDEGIIRLALYFFRNVAMLSQPQNLPADVDEAEISRSTTIDAFSKQLIFDVLLTLASGMGDQFALQDVIVMETLFYILKGVDPDKLFMNDEQLTNTKHDELKDLMKKEKALQAGYKRYAPSRHNRFGTMVWLKRPDEKRTTLTGQGVISGPGRDLAQLDKIKKWNKPQFKGRKADVEPAAEFDKPVSLSQSARKNLRHFISRFIDSGFNPLFTHLRKTIESELDRVQDVHKTQFFYLISWFLKAECARRRADKQKQASNAKSTTPGTLPEEDAGFAYVASCLDQETFILLNRHMQRSMDEKAWPELHAEMRCFTQILLTVQEMAESPLDDDQEIAENIQARLFYEESTHDRIVKILREYNDQGFGYLDACTELAHVFIRMVERYSKENVDMQVRFKRRSRKKRAKVAGNDNERPQSDAEDHREAEVTSRERKFEFAKFQGRFMSQAVVDTFVHFLKFFNDLSKDQLKRVHRYFYRLAFKNELSVLLYRVDIIQLFHKMVKGPEGLDTSTSIYKDWAELSKQLFRRLIKKLEERPELMVEMLFSKRPDTIYYLEHGHDKELPKKSNRPAAEMQLKPGVDYIKGIGAAIGLLQRDDKTDLVEWVREQLERAYNDRKSWADMDAARAANGDEMPAEPPKAPSILLSTKTDEIRKATYKNGRLRLLMSLVNFERLGLDDDPEASYLVPSAVTPDQLEADLKAVTDFLACPQQYDDGRDHEDFIRRRANTNAAANDDQDAPEVAAFLASDSEDGLDFVDEAMLFPAGGPTTRKADAIEQLKKKRRQRKGAAKEVDDSEKARRAKARAENEAEKRRKIKSDLFVRESDDETDEERDREFFAAEAKRRNEAKRGIKAAVERLGKRADLSDEGSVNGAAKKRKTADGGITTKKRRKAPAKDITIDISSDESSALSSDSDDDTVEKDADEEETPLSSQNQPSPEDMDMPDVNDIAVEKSKVVSRGKKLVLDDESDAEDDVMPQPARRRNVRAGFLLDSDEDE